MVSISVAVFTLLKAEGAVHHLVLRAGFDGAPGTQHVQRAVAGIHVAAIAWLSRLDALRQAGNERADDAGHPLFGVDAVVSAVDIGQHIGEAAGGGVDAILAA